jgi:NADPH-dependent 2,4-dienoyl-CoA reductase/sulfur reductase-like enzyme
MTDALSPDSHAVVVGASAAGLAAAEALRRYGFAGRLSIVGAEGREPYDRPPLSKQLLRGTWQAQATRRGVARRLASRMAPRTQRTGA